MYGPEHSLGLGFDLIKYYTSNGRKPSRTRTMVKLNDDQLSRQSFSFFSPPNLESTFRADTLHMTTKWEDAHQTVAFWSLDIKW